MPFEVAFQVFLITPTSFNKIKVLFYTHCSVANCINSNSIFLLKAHVYDLLNNGNMHECGGYIATSPTNTHMLILVIHKIVQSLYVSYYHALIQPNLCHSPNNYNYSLQHFKTIFKM